MPLEGIDEEGLPHNPDIEAAQLKFLLTLENAGVDKEGIWRQLLKLIEDKCNIQPLICDVIQLSM